MCQVTPFTLPCCKRVYVEVLKLPSCPDTWPASKCPPELCLQVHGYEPEDHTSGTCWRCQAALANKTGEERERMRPAIDSADIVVGLEEFDVAERRKIVEDRGECWFCGVNTKGHDAECEDVKEKQQLPAPASKRVRPESSARLLKKRPKRRMDVGRNYSNRRAALSASASVYTNPTLNPQFHTALPYPTVRRPDFNTPFTTIGARQGGYQFGDCTYGGSPLPPATMVPFSSILQPEPQYHGGIFTQEHQFPAHVQMNYGQDQVAGAGGNPHPLGSGLGNKFPGENIPVMMNGEQYSNIDNSLTNDTWTNLHKQPHLGGIQASDEVAPGHESAQTWEHGTGA